MHQDAYCDIIEKCQITLTLNQLIRPQQDLLKKLVNLKFTVTSLAPIILKCDTFPRPETLVILTQTLRNYNTLKEKKEIEYSLAPGEQKKRESNGNIDKQPETVMTIKKKIYNAALFFYGDTHYLLYLKSALKINSDYEVRFPARDPTAEEFLAKLRDFKIYEIDAKEKTNVIITYVGKVFTDVKAVCLEKDILTIMGQDADLQTAKKTILFMLKTYEDEADWFIDTEDELERLELSGKSVNKKSNAKTKSLDAKSCKILTLTDKLLSEYEDLDANSFKEIGQFYASQTKSRNMSSLNATSCQEKVLEIFFENVQHGGAGLKDTSIKQSDTFYDDQHKQATEQAYRKTSPDGNKEQRHSSELKTSEAVYIGSSGIKVYVYTANITELQVDCIVNAANSYLKHFGGVAAVIAKAAGPSLVQQCVQFIADGNVVAVTDIFVSGSGDLNAKKVIHAVGPRWEDYDSDQKQKCLEDLKKVVLRCLIEASWMKMVSIALPSISSAIYKVPKQECAESYMKAVKSFDALVKKLNLSSLQDIHFVDINNEMVSTVAGCVLENKNQVLTSEALHEDLAFVQKHLGRSRELNIGKEASIFPSNCYYNCNMGFSRKVVEHKDYYIGKTKLRITTQHAMDFNTDLIITVGEPFDKLSGKSSFRTRKSKINSESQQFEFFTYEYEDKPPRFLCVLGVNFVSDAEIVAAVKNLNSAISCYPNLVQSLVVTSKFLYPEKKLFSSKQPDSNLVTIISQLVYNYVKNASRDSVMKSVLISTSEEAFSSIIQVIDALESSGQAGLGGSSVDDICSHCKRSVRDVESLQCCKKIYCLKCREEHKNCSLSQKAFFRIYTGNQPDGDMIVTERRDLPIPGYTTCGVFLIEYVFPNCVQNQLHPDPGKPYFGCHVVAYLPTTQEGYNVLKLLRVAFLRRLTFTIGTYNGRDYHVTWSGINLYLYDNNTDLIDSNYLLNVTAELRSKGVTMDNLTQEELADLERLRQYLNSKKYI